MAVRGDAAPRRQRGKELLDARYRQQFALKGYVDLGAHRFEEPAGQRAPKSGFDLGSQSQAIFAKTEDHGLVDRRRKIGGDQALAENAPEDQLTVDEDTIAIENDKIGHDDVFSQGPVVIPTQAPPGPSRFQSSAT